MKQILARHPGVYGNWYCVFTVKAELAEELLSKFKAQNPNMLYKIRE